MTREERLAYFLEHGMTDADFLAKVAGVTPQQFRAAIAKVIQQRKVTNAADQNMRIDASIREMDSRQWKALPLEQQLERGLFLLRTFNA